MEIVVKEKPSDVSFEAIQTIIAEAHKSNEKAGMLFATARQSPEKLAAKIGENGACFVAYCDGALAGTMSVSFRKLKYWYCDDDVAIIKLGGVKPEFKGRGLASALLKQCLETAANRGVNVVVCDTAEQNDAMGNMLLKYGFQRVDYCKYAANNFYTAVYVKRLDGSTYSRWYCGLRYCLKKIYIRWKYKPNEGRV
ncbi:MAG: GNAT family N-acetyltransferase [Thermoguttaceae bacterium]|nr:GNAT family N-acetyltransferase [Thermoguttaceae bacterium]